MEGKRRNEREHAAALSSPVRIQGKGSSESRTAAGLCVCVLRRWVCLPPSRLTLRLRWDVGMRWQLSGGAADGQGGELVNKVVATQENKEERKNGRRTGWFGGPCAKIPRSICAYPGLDITEARRHHEDTDG